MLVVDSGTHLAKGEDSVRSEDVAAAFQKLDEIPIDQFRWLVASIGPVSAWHVVQKTMI